MIEQETKAPREHGLWSKATYGVRLGDHPQVPWRRRLQEARLHGLVDAEAALRGARPRQGGLRDRLARSSGIR
jgi:hypothetical protein